MNNMTMQLASPEWTAEAMAEMFAEDGTATDVAALAAETVIAWLVLNTHKRLAGWSYNFGTFCGPYSAEAASAVLAIFSDATDYAIERLDEITAEAIAERH